MSGGGGEEEEEDGGADWVSSALRSGRALTRGSRNACPSTRTDLVPREVVEAWLKYFREELPAVAFKCSTQQQAANLGRRAAGAGKPAAAASTRGAECLGADTLLQLLKNYARSADIKTAITVGVVGLPNVGKSSLINSLKRTRVAQVGNTPGVTKTVQEVHLDRQVTLLDSPGVVFAADGPGGAAAAALRNAVKTEQLSDPVLPVAEIVARCPARQLMTLYKVPAFAAADEFLQHVAQVSAAVACATLALLPRIARHVGR